MPISVVFDASFVMALFVPHPLELSAQVVIDQQFEADATLMAPTLWVYEVINGIHKLAHFKQISATQAERALTFASRFRITLVEPDFSLARRAVAWSQRLQRASAYDSFYLALAQDCGCDLWTADSKLANAAKEN